MRTEIDLGKGEGCCFPEGGWEGLSAKGSLCGALNKAQSPWAHSGRVRGWVEGCREAGGAGEGCGRWAAGNEVQGEQGARSGRGSQPQEAFGS